MLHVSVLHKNKIATQLSIMNRMILTPFVIYGLQPYVCTGGLLNWHIDLLTPPSHERLENFGLYVVKKKQKNIPVAKQPEFFFFFTLPPPPSGRSDTYAAHVWLQLSWNGDV